MSAGTPLDELLDHVAHAVAEAGTATELAFLERLSAAAAEVSPGAAAALVDWDGAEVARLRAYGVLHARVSALGPAPQAALLDELRYGAELALTG